MYQSKSKQSKVVSFVNFKLYILEDKRVIEGKMDYFVISGSR